MNVKELSLQMLDTKFPRLGNQNNLDLKNFKGVKSYQDDRSLIMFNGAPFTVEKISPRAGIESVPRSIGQAYPTELPGLLISRKQKHQKNSLSNFSFKSVCDRICHWYLKGQGLPG